MTVNTKQSERRELVFASIHELTAEIDRIEAAHRAGTLRTTGNWTTAQILEHCARTWAAAMDGFPPEAKPPAIIKFFAKLLFKKKAIAGDTAPPGIKLPQVLIDALVPEPGFAFEDAIANLRAQIKRVSDGGRFDAPSPLFGNLTHDEWQRLQLGHCQLHFGFIHLS